MRPFICSILKCDKCEEINSYRIVPYEIAKTPLPKCLPKIEDFKDQSLFLSDLIKSVSKIGKNVIEIEDTDLQLFMECENISDSPEDFKIVELLYGISIVNGYIICNKCDTKKNIKNKILIYNE